MVSDRFDRAEVPLRTHALAAMLRRAGIVAALGSLVCVGAGRVGAQAPSAPAPARGQALYDTRCIACHDRSVHRRESRQARDFAALRREVLRWSGTAGADWRDDEVDAVTGYLNDRYYRFPCPAEVCPPAPRADAGG
jgi:mono/diheme cytochrome c family protein